MNNLYCELKLPFNLVTPDFPKQEGTFEHLTELSMFSHSKETLDPLLLTLISDLGMVVYWSEVFYNPPYTDVPVHVDTNHLSNMCKINIHIGNPQCTIKWYRPLPDFVDKIPLRTPLNTEYLMYDKNEVEVIHSQVINHISLMNAGVPHSFENNTPDPSWILSIVLFKDGFNAQFDEALDLFKDYIEE